MLFTSTGIPQGNYSYFFFCLFSFSFPRYSQSVIVFNKSLLIMISVTCTMSGRNVQYAGEAGHGSASTGFVYQPNGYKSPQEQPHQSYNQNQNAASYNTAPVPPRQRDPLPRPQDDGTTTTIRGNRIRSGNWEQRELLVRFSPSC